MQGFLEKYFLKMYISTGTLGVYQKFSALLDISFTLISELKMIIFVCRPTSGHKTVGACTPGLCSPPKDCAPILMSHHSNSTWLFMRINLQLQLIRINNQVLLDDGNRIIIPQGNFKFLRLECNNIFKICRAGPACLEYFCKLPMGRLM